MGTSLADATWADRSTYALFMILWIVYGLINQYCGIHRIAFDATTLVWSQEVLKIVLSVGLFCVQDGGPVRLVRSGAEHWSMVCWYLIPAGLYALTDVLTYVELRTFDPATYHLLGELKLVLVGVVHQFFFKRRLGAGRWVALGIITVGCVVKTLDSLEDHHSGRRLEGTADDDDGGAESESFPQQSKPTLINYLLLFVVILSSTVAGVYNEKLLKDKPSIPVNLQNICLYFDGILFLTLGMAAGIDDAKTPIAEALSPAGLRALFAEPAVVAMAVTMSVAGIVTSRFLRAFDSVRKSIAVSLVVVCLPFLSWALFGTAVTTKMVLSVLTVVGGMYLYSVQPPPGSHDTGRGNDEVLGGADDALVFESSSPVVSGDMSEEYAHLTQKERLDSLEDGLIEEEESEIELPSSEGDTSLSSKEDDVA